jgi:chemotaxis protein CheX
MTTETQKHLLDLPNAFADLNPLTAFLRGARSAAVEIDCSNVAAMPSRCLQMLLSAEQQWRSEELGFAVTHINDSCRKSLTLLGLEPNRFEDEVTA